MDQLDMRIVRELMRGNVRDMMLLDASELRKSFRSIARSLHVDQGTIRNRIKKLKDAGLIRGWHVAINPSLYGRQLCCLMMDVNPSYDKREAVKRISSIDDVTLINNFMGPLLQVLVSFENDEALAKTGKMITDIAGDVSARWMKRPTAKVTMELTKSDWEIIKILQQDPWKPNEEIAKAVHLSSKTTRKKIVKLADEGAIEFSVNVNLSVLKGIVPATLVVFYKYPSRRNQTIRLITDYLGDELFFGAIDDPQIGVFGLVIPNLARLEDIENWASKLPDLNGCRTVVLIDIILPRISYQKEIDQLVLESTG